MEAQQPRTQLSIWLLFLLLTLLSKTFTKIREYYETSTPGVVGFFYSDPTVGFPIRG